MKYKEFEKIAGYKEEKEELINLCNLLKNKNEIEKLGGKLPKGLLLIGPNGVGKTVMAKAFIKESKYNVVEISYNDISQDEEFIPYVKTKFAEAANKTPCILFIDEIDKMIGNNRNYFMTESFDKSRVFLNEINRYSDVDDLFLLIIANQEYDLDDSITRSGRIDKILEINLPNEKERLDIINYYCKNKNLEKDMDLEGLSKLLVNFSGADIESLINDAVLKSFTEERKSINYKDVTSVYYDKQFSCKEKDNTYDEDSLRMVAYHEAGHAVTSLYLKENSINCVSILARNKVSGFAGQMNNGFKIKTLKDALDNIKVCLAGLVSEEIFFENNRSNGSGSDLSKAKMIVQDLVRCQGYCGLDKLNFNTPGHFAPTRTISDEKLALIDKTEGKILKEAYEETKEIVLKNKNYIEAIVKELLDKKVLYKEDISRIYKECEENERI